MWDLITKYKAPITVFIILILAIVLARPLRQIGGAQRGFPYLWKNPYLYYQQHSFFPWGAWCPMFQNHPKSCHTKSRSACSGRFLYDNCYKRNLKNCLQ